MCMLFLYTFHKHFEKIWVESQLNNKVMNVCLTMCQRVRSTSQIIFALFSERGGQMF